MFHAAVLAGKVDILFLHISGKERKKKVKPLNLSVARRLRKRRRPIWLSILVIS